MKGKNLNELGKIVREHRTANDIKSVDFARDLGVSQSYISDLENGKKKKPRIEILEKIANYFGGSDDGMVKYIYIQLLELAGYTEERNSIAHFGASEKEEKEIVPLAEFIKNLENEESSPLKKNEFMLLYKDSNGNESMLRNHFDEVPSIFDLYPWLFNDSNIVTKRSDGITFYGKPVLFYKGKELSYEDKIKIKKVLDAIFEIKED